MDSVRQQARIAGRWYLAMGLSAPIGLMYVPEKIFVAGDAAATADNLRAFEGTVRLGLGADLLHQALAIFLVLALYRLFKPVNEDNARELVILGALVSVPIMFMNALNYVGALIMVSGAEYLAAFAREQLDALAYLFMQLHNRGVTVASVFWGLWLFPFGLLIVRSGFIPKVFGWLLFMAGGAYLVSAFFTLVLPDYRASVNSVAQLLEMAEVPIIFYLLIWGARPPKTP